MRRSASSTSHFPETGTYRTPPCSTYRQPVLSSTPFSIIFGIVGLLVFSTLIWLKQMVNSPHIPQSQQLKDTVKKEVLASVTVGVLTVVSKDAQQQGLNAVHLQSISTDIVLEGSTVMDNVRDFPPGSLPHILDCVCPSLRLPKIHGKHT